MPEAIAHFKVLDHLGSGGLGEVYRARDTRVGRTVAVKVLPERVTSDRERLAAIGDAAKAASVISHPNITALFEGGVDGADYYLVFEFVQGDPLSALIDGRALNLRRAVELAIQIADALAEVESRGKVHGDIRPGTIVVTSKDRAKLMNFGVAGFTAGGSARRSAHVAYVAPEEMSGPSHDIRSDIYSLGAVLFEMLTGRPRGEGLAPSSINRAVPSELDRIVGRMLASRPEQRFQSAASVAGELRAIAAILEARATAEEAEMDSRRRRHDRRAPSRAVWIALVVAIVAMLLWLARAQAWRFWR
jgi:serine/threonine protein kinase